MNKKFRLFVCALLVVMSSMLSACNKHDGFGLLAEKNRIEQTVEKAVKDSCPDKNHDGYCDLMGK